ncbi:MAG: hypothetical protein RR891_02815 [Clostridium sp.]
MLFDKGEVRQVGIEVINQLGRDFIIEAVDYEIIRSTGEIILKGYATVEGHKILTLFSATETGDFYCIFTYRVAAEILKAKIYIQVR